MKTWNQEDFSKMGWHDCVIWAMRFDDNLYFDLDYIMDTISSNESLKHVIVPVTLIFYDVENFSINVEGEWVNGFEINRIKQEELSDKKCKWIIELQEGLISFESPKFEQFTKKKAVISDSGCLDEKVRGGYNFNYLTTADTEDNR